MAGVGAPASRGLRAIGLRAFAALLAALAVILIGGSSAAQAAAPATSAAPAALSPSPAFATTPAPGGGLTVAEARAAVEARGYSPADTSGYDPDRTLSVILGVLATSADGHPQRAFFFHHGQYVGTDAAVPSAGITWIWSSDDTVALQYQLYTPDDPMCCPTAGATTVRFVWTGTAVKPTGALPPTDWNAPASRR